MVLNIATLGAHHRIQKATEHYEDRLDELKDLNALHEKRKEDINTLFHDVIEVKKAAIIELRKVKKITDALNVKQRQEIDHHLEGQDYSLDKIDSSMKAGEMAISATKLLIRQYCEVYMSEKNLNELVKKIPDLPAADITSAFRMFMEYQKESEITKREIKRLDIAKEVLLTEIEKKYDFYHRIFATVFSERKQAIDKFFEIIDKGIKENDRELISVGLSNLSNVVASSPFSNIGELTKLIESGKTIDL